MVISTMDSMRVMPRKVRVASVDGRLSMSCRARVVNVRADGDYEDSVKECERKLKRSKWSVAVEAEDEEYASHGPRSRMRG